jgi:hypothetical protein
LSWPEAPVLVPRRGAAVDPLDVSGPEASDGSSPSGVLDESDPVAGAVSCACNDGCVIAMRGPLRMLRFIAR